MVCELVPWMWMWRGGGLRPPFFFSIQTHTHTHTHTGTDTHTHTHDSQMHTHTHTHVTHILVGFVTDAITHDRRRGVSSIINTISISIISSSSRVGKPGRSKQGAVWIAGVDSVSCQWWQQLAAPRSTGVQHMRGRVWTHAPEGAWQLWCRGVVVLLNTLKVEMGREKLGGEREYVCVFGGGEGEGETRRVGNSDAGGGT